MYCVFFVVVVVAVCSVHRVIKHVKVELICKSFQIKTLTHNLKLYKRLLKHECFISHVNCPGKLVPLCAVVHLLDGDIPFLAPGHGNSGVKVVQLGRPKSYLLILFL